MRIAAIVEGDCDVLAVPILLSQAALLVGSEAYAPKPIQAGEWKKLRHEGRLEKYLHLAHSRRYDKIMIILDLEDQACCEAVAEIMPRVEHWKNGRTIDVSVVFMVKEYETMFLHRIDDIGVNDVRLVPAEPDNVRGAKEVVAKVIGRRYRARQDQPGFTRKMNLKELYTVSRPFQKLMKNLTGMSYAEIDGLLTI